jgi:hypothetical protein
MLLPGVRRAARHAVALLLVCGPAPGRGQVGGTPFDLPGGSPDAAIPTPESVLGVPIGTRPARYDEVRRYLEALDAASPRVEVRTYARSHEGRDLVYAVIGTEARLRDLAAVQAAVTQWADPRRAGGGEPPADLPLVAWLGYGIHGDELSSTDAAMQLAYQLAAGQDSVTERIRDRLLVCIDPMQNPDGRERYLAQMQQVAGRVPNPDAQSLQHQGYWPWGRANHYLFDLNRDWIYVVHPETAGRVRTIASWRPQLVVDSHEMGWDETYLFSPPREPFNPHLPPVMQPWWPRFARDQAAAFDRRGWSYYTREWNEEFYPGYGSSWSMYHGAVGILYEQAGTDGSLVRQPDGTVLTYLDAVAHQWTSSITNLDTAARHRTALLRDYRAGRRAAFEAGRRGPVRAFAWSGADSVRAAHLTQVLVAQGIEVYRARGPLVLPDAHDPWGGSSGRRTLPPGSAVVPLDQPLAPLARNLLEFHVAMPDSFLREERDWLERDRGTRLYEVTAWSLLLGHALESYWTTGAPQGDLERVETLQPAPGRVVQPRPDYGYVVDGASDLFAPAVARLLEGGASVRIALEPFTVGGRRFARGSALLRVQANPPGVHDLVARVAEATGVTVWGLNSGQAGSGPDLGGGRFPVLEPPRIALVAGEPVSFASYGALWHLLDHDLQMRVSSLNARSLADLDLDKYNVLVLSRAYGGGAAWARALGPGGLGRLREWIEAGGTLVAIGEAAACAADTAQALTKARLRHQVLKEFAPAAARLERPEIGLLEAVGDAPRPGPGAALPLLGPAAQAYVRLVRPAGVGVEGLGQRVPAAAAARGGPEPGDDALRLADDRLRRFQPRGAMLRVDLASDHWLTAGLPARVPVLVDGDLALVARSPVRIAGRYARADSLHLGGLLWPEAADRLARTAFLTQERRGRGQVILFAADPSFRRSLRGLERLLLNAVLLGPGLGTERTAPW